MVEQTIAELTLPELTLSELTMATRTERDGLGSKQLPRDALYGIHTLRALENFPISGIPLSHFPDLIVALATVKQAAADCNLKAGQLDPVKAEAIISACEDLRAGQHHQAFVVDMIQGGAGTSTNMNANEVIANLALLKLGAKPGDYALISPNDHVNMSQSTNDVYPTALRLSMLAGVGPLQQALRTLQAAFEAKAQEFREVLKVGRTQLQDAVPMTLGAEFKSFAVTVSEDVARLGEMSRLLLEINLGGTAIGTSINAVPAYCQTVVARLAQLSGLPVIRAEDLIEASSDLGGFVTFSGIMRRIAVKVSKICNDLRLLSSGPRAGLSEITLPAVQAGSSIMPGKINPVIPEVFNQIAYQVVGADLTVVMAAEAGQLQLNAMEPIAAYNILNSMRLLHRGLDVLTHKCVTGITANVAQCRAQLDNSLIMVTALVPLLGYERATEIAKRAIKDQSSIMEAARALGVTEQSVFDLLSSPQLVLNV